MSEDSNKIKNEIIEELEQLKIKSFEEILQFYSHPNSIGLDDIYYYLYKNTNNNNEIKYSDKFRKINKGPCYNRKKYVQKKTKKFSIDNDKRLITVLTRVNIFISL